MHISYGLSLRGDKNELEENRRNSKTGTFSSGCLCLISGEK